MVFRELLQMVNSPFYIVIVLKCMKWFLENC
jgi:hypothetical protein